MMSANTTLLEALASLLGDSSFKPEDPTQMILSCDGFLVHLAIIDTTALRCSAWIASLEEETPRQELYSILLAANHFFALTNGATLSVDPATQEVWLHQETSLEGMDASRAYTFVEHFVSVAVDWYDKLNPEEDQEGSDTRTRPTQPTVFA